MVHDDVHVLRVLVGGLCTPYGSTLHPYDSSITVRGTILREDHHAACCVYSVLST